MDRENTDESTPASLIQLQRHISTKSNETENSKMANEKQRMPTFYSNEEQQNISHASSSNTSDIVDLTDKPSKENSMLTKIRFHRHQRSQSAHQLNLNTAFVKQCEAVMSPLLNVDLLNIPSESGSSCPSLSNRQPNINRSRMASFSSASNIHTKSSPQTSGNATPKVIL